MKHPTDMDNMENGSHNPDKGFLVKYTTISTVSSTNCTNETPSVHVHE